MKKSFILLSCIVIIISPLYAGDIEMQLSTDDGTTQFQIKDINNNNLVVIDSVANVGIGTDEPSSPLHVKGQQKIQSDLPANAFPGQLEIGALTDDGTKLARMNFNEGGNVKAQIAAARGSGEFTGFLAFLTRNGAPFERMRIDENGNVGIGTVNPQRTVHINNLLRLEPLSGSQPASPSLGDLYVDGDTNEICFYNGTSFVGMTGGLCN